MTERIETLVRNRDAIGAYLDVVRGTAARDRAALPATDAPEEHSQGPVRPVMARP